MATEIDNVEEDGAGVVAINAIIQPLVINIVGDGVDAASEIVTGWLYDTAAGADEVLAGRIVLPLLNNTGAGTVQVTQLAQILQAVAVVAHGVDLLRVVLRDNAAVTAAGVVAITQNQIRHLVEEVGAGVDTAHSHKITTALLDVFAVGLAEMLNRFKDSVNVAGAGATSSAGKLVALNVATVAAAGVTAVTNQIVGNDVVLNVNGDGIVTAIATAIARELATEIAHGKTSLTDGLGASAWTALAETFGMSRYVTPVLNAIAEIDGSLYASGTEGIYKLTPGADDAGPADVEASLTTGLTDFGDGRLKRPQYFRIGYDSAGVMGLRVVETSSGADAGYDYQFPARTSGVQVPGKVTLGRGIRSRYIRFVLKNVDGAPFTVTDAQVDLLETSRKV